MLGKKAEIEEKNIEICKVGRRKAVHVKCQECGFNEMKKKGNRTDLNKKCSNIVYRPIGRT